MSPPSQGRDLLLEVLRGRGVVELRQHEPCLQVGRARLALLRDLLRLREVRREGEDPPGAARAGDRRFWRLSGLRAHTKAP